MFRNISSSENNKSSISELFSARRGQSLLLLVELSIFVLLIAPTHSQADTWSDMPCDQHQSPQSGVRDRTLWQRIADNHSAAASKPMPTAAELAERVLFYVDKEANDRLRIVDPKDDPMLSAVGRAYFTDDDGKRYSAVATLLNDCKVLISAHLTTPIEDRSRSSIGKRIEFEFKHNGSLIKPAGEVVFNAYHSPRLVPHNDETALDHAIVNLPMNQCKLVKGILPAFVESDLGFVSHGEKSANQTLFMATYRESFGEEGDRALEITVPKRTNVHMKETCTRAQWSKLASDRRLGLVNCTSHDGSSGAPLYRLAKINGVDRMIVLATISGSPSEEVAEKLGQQGDIELIRTDGVRTGIRSTKRTGGSARRVVGVSFREVLADYATEVSPFLNLALIRSELSSSGIDVSKLLVPNDRVN